MNIKMIVISNPVNINDEISIIVNLFKNGLDIFHLRKPDFNLDEYKSIIDAIPAEYHNKIVIHSNYELTDMFNLKGIHLPEYIRNNNEQNDLFSKYNVVSTSFHNLNDLNNINNVYQYVFLSPVFNSISKKNYNSTFNAKDISLTLKNSTAKVIALGGINQKNAKQAIDMGFDGIALHGAIWQSNNPVETFIEIKQS